MNDYSIILEISNLTKNWTLSDWKRFRSLNDYWAVKSGCDKQHFDKKRKIWHYRVYSAWLKWKLENIKEYLADNQ